jgi:hypothetical protein
MKKNFETDILKKLIMHENLEKKKEKVIEDANVAINRLLEINAKEEAIAAQDKLKSIIKEKPHKSIQEQRNELMKNATAAIDGLISLHAQHIQDESKK